MTTTPGRRVDRGYRGILVAVSVVTLWLLAMPFSRFIQQTTLDRFHLQTRSFPVWAIQAPVPAMYNFHNRYRVEPRLQDSTSPSEPLTGTVNHFPVRLYTFGNTRRVMMLDRSRHMLTVESRYRGRSLMTRWVVAPNVAGGFDLIDRVVP
jgi:hypothetical protein